MPHPEYVKKEATEVMNASILHTGGQLLGRSSPVVARTPPQAKKGRSPEVEQSFGVYNIYMRRIVFELCLSEKNKEDEQN